MVRFKTYYPDKGLSHVVVLDNNEYDEMIVFIRDSNILEHNKQARKKKEIMLEELDKERYPLIVIIKDKMFSDILKRYEIDESIGIIIDRNTAEKDEVFSRRYKALKAKNTLA
jgi:histidinol phosphatase-like enzyme